MDADKDKEFLGQNFSTEDFISEIEKWPAIWDLTHDDYSNKLGKKNAWQSIIEKFLPNFNKLSMMEKKSIATSYQRKWKSLRDSYTREKSKQRKEIKSGAANKFRKIYVFFEQLRFLETTTKPTEDSDGNGEENEERNIRMEESNENPNIQRKVKEKKRRNKEDQDDELMDILRAKYLQQETGNNREDDDDKLFLLSLHHDLKTLPDNLKLIVKSQLISVLSSAKQLVFASSTVPQFSSSTMQQYPSSSHQYPHQPPPQSYHQTPTTNLPPATRPYQGNEALHQARSCYSSPQSPNESISNTSDVSDFFSEG